MIKAVETGESISLTNCNRVKDKRGGGELSARQVEMGLCSWFFADLLGIVAAQVV